MYRIKELRKAKNMTCEELAKRSNVSRTTIYWLENNIKEIAMTKTLLAIAKVLECSVSDLFMPNDKVG